MDNAIQYVTQGSTELPAKYDACKKQLEALHADESQMQEVELQSSINTLEALKDLCRHSQSQAYLSESEHQTVFQCIESGLSSGNSAGRRSHDASCVLQQSLQSEQTSMDTFIEDSQAQEFQKWEALQSCTNPKAFQAAAAEIISGNRTAARTCQSLAEKIWTCLTDKELLYVKTLQEQAKELDSLLTIISQQSRAFEAASKQHTQEMQDLLQQVIIPI